MADGPNGRERLDARLTAAEGGLVHQQATLAALREDHTRFQAEARQQLGEMRRTPWGDLWKGLGVILTVLGMVGALVAYGINSRIDEVKARVAEHVSMPSHAVGGTELVKNRSDIDALKEKVLELDIALQREMRLLDEALQSEFGQRFAAIEETQRRHGGELMERGMSRFTREEHEAFLAQQFRPLEERLRAVEQGK